MNLHLMTLISMFYLSTAEFNFFNNIKMAIKVVQFDTDTFRAAYENNTDVTKSIIVECYNPNTKRNLRIKGLQDPDIPIKLNMRRKIGFIFHGWMDSFDHEWVTDVFSAWTQNRRENVCRVDWSYLAKAEYVNASRTSILVVANYMVQLINEINVNYKVKYSDIILVGHSLGAHIAGIIGYEVNEPIGLIIGLDPPGPLFTIPTVIPDRYRLDSRDALIVQVIHTSDGSAGPTIDIGTQDIRINTGFIPQPGCTYPNLVNTYHNDLIRCSHLRSVQFFKSSLINNRNCRAVRCDNMLQYLLRKCSKIYDVLGLDTEGIPGTFYIASLDEPECINQQYKV